MIYLVPEEMSVYIEELGRDVRLHARQQLDDQFHEDSLIIAELGPRGIVRRANVEAATAAPGEVRTTRRKKEEAA